MTRPDGTPVVGGRRSPDRHRSGGRYRGRPPVERRGGPAAGLGGTGPPMPIWRRTSWRRWTTPAGPARVIAPAGSGKTRVLTERLRLLVPARHRPGGRHRVAYNTRAADELRERAADVLGPAGPAHPHPEQPGPVDLQPLRAGRARCGCSTSRGCGTWSSEVFEVKRQANTDTSAPYLAGAVARAAGAASPRCGGGGVSRRHRTGRRVRRGSARRWPSAARSTSTSRSTGPSRSCWPTRRPGLRPRPAAGALLVDEFQDLTPAHLLLIRLLAAPGFDCFGVGDDDQVIYGYSGADPEFLIDFAGYFPGAVGPCRSR